MVKFPINPIALVYCGDNCYVTIAALIAISQSSYSLLSWGLGHLRCLVLFLSGAVRGEQVADPEAWAKAFLDNGTTSVMSYSDTESWISKALSPTPTRHCSVRAGRIPFFESFTISLDAGLYITPIQGRTQEFFGGGGGGGVRVQLRGNVHILTSKNNPPRIRHCPTELRLWLEPMTLEKLLCNKLCNNTV